MNPEAATFVAPEIAVSHFHIKDGDVVADYGAGNGAFLKFLSVRTPAGRVYACEIQKSLVESLGAQMRAQGLSNVYPLWCDLEEPNGIPIETGAVDVGVLVNTLFMFENKEVGITEIGRTIRHGGRLLIIDWSESFGGLGPAPHHVVTEADTTALLESHRFVLEQTFPAGAHHYGLAFRKI